MPDFTSDTSYWNLRNIISEFRFITGRPDASMISDQGCVDLINFYYTKRLSQELKIFWNYTFYNFFTKVGVDQYVAPDNEFSTFNPAIYCDGFPVTWYLDPDNFYSDYPNQENKLVVGFGNGAQTTFPFSLSSFPILIGSVYVTDGTQVAVDNGNGGFNNPNSGSINYVSGAVSVTFENPPPANANITATSVTYMSARPQSLLYYRAMPLPDSTYASRENANFFVLRPVPDQVYQIKMSGVQQPPPLINYTDVPFRKSLGPLVAMGAALHMFIRFNQMDQYNQYYPEYVLRKDIAMQDTYEEYLYMRAIPAF